MIHLTCLFTTARHLHLKNTPLIGYVCSRRGLLKRVLKSRGAWCLLRLYKQLFGGYGACQDGVQTEIGARWLLQGETDQRSRPTVVLWVNGETGAAVSSVHHVSTGKSLIKYHFNTSLFLCAKQVEIITVCLRKYAVTLLTLYVSQAHGNKPVLALVVNPCRDKTLCHMEM